MSVSWEWVAAPQLDAAVTDPASATAVRVAVRDTGVGIAAEEQQAIWEEFRQARNRAPEGQQGTGLGLALTRRLVALLGGAIGLESAPGRGSTFTFVLPCRLPDPAASSAEVEEAAGRPVALVIEDHEPTNKLLRDWLREAGLATAWALDGEAGLVKARHLRPALIVLDIRLPKMDGLQVLTELKGDPATADIPVVIVTMDEQLRPATTTAVQEFFVKPVDRDRFLSRLQERLPGVFRAGRPPRVLVVDDDPASRTLLGDVLRLIGAEVAEAEDGRQAMERLREETPDLVLLDLLMPEMDGFAVIEQVRGLAATAEVPIVVVSARDLDAAERERLHGQIQALVQKSVLTPEGLREQLRALGVLRPEPEAK